MLGVEIVAPETGRPDPKTAWSIVVQSLKRGIILLVSGMEGNVISLTPPLTITESQLHRAVEIMGQALTVSGRA